MCAALAGAALPARAWVDIHVSAQFDATGFADGPVYGTTGPASFDVTLRVDETAAVLHTAGTVVAVNDFEPRSVVLAHDVYSLNDASIQSVSGFSFGTLTVTPPVGRHNLSFALLFNGTLAAPLFITDLTPGSSPLMEAILAPSVGLGGYDFGPFTLGQPRSVFLTNAAQVWDGVHNAYGTVQVSISAVPEPAAAGLLSAGLAVLAWRRRASGAAR